MRPRFDVQYDDNRPIATFLGHRLQNGSPFGIGPLSVLSCMSVTLSVTFVYCGQTVRWIKIPLGMEVGLDTGQIVLHGYPAPIAERGTAPQFSAQVCFG